MGTWRWNPEDFNLEVATYMQCEEPWEAPPRFNAPVALKARGFTAGRAGKPIRIPQHVPDDGPEDILDDDVEVKRCPPHAGVQQSAQADATSCEAALIDMEEPRVIDIQ